MNFDNLFNNFNTQDSYAILFFMLIAFLFGLLTGYLLRGRKIRRLKKELKASENKRKELEVEIESLNEEGKLKEADLQKAIYEKEEEAAKVLRLEAEQSKLYNQLLEANSELEKLQASNTSYHSTIEDLNSQLNKLETQEETFVFEKGIDPETGQAERLFKETENRLQSFEKKLSKLESENSLLKGALAGLKHTTTRQAVEKAPEGMEELVISAEKKGLKEKIIVDVKERDELTKIKGLGPFLEHKLNAEGIFTYEQLAALSAGDVDELTEKIGYLPGRIEKDDWRGQAAKLAKIKRKNPSAFETKAKMIADSEDLKIIEGIGPKIEQIFKEAGISDLATLAEISVEKLEGILEAAGGRYTRHKPATWPAQARLAANQEWKLLKEYQDELQGGRVV